MERTKIAGFRLGKKVAKHDLRTLKFSQYLGPELRTMQPKSEVSFQAKVPRWPMLLNDRLGDCTIAAAGHQIQQWTSYAGKAVVPQDDQILKAYEDVGGYQPGQPETDNGAYILDVLKYWRKTGVAGHKIGAFASLKPGNFLEMKLALQLFGSVYIGLALPIAAANEQVIWHVSDGGIYKPAGQPWSWGGHAVPIVAYDKNCIVVVTWGRLMEMSWNFYLDYCDEAYAVLSPDWISENGKSPSGFYMDQLKADLTAITTL